MFWDEFGFSFQESLATTWARIGKRPVFRRVSKKRRALSTAVALTLSGKIYKRHFEGSIKSENLIETLEHVQRKIPGKIILIWDRASIHLSKLTKAYLQDHPEILIEELPAYAPELNPEEYCHGNVKQHLKNARPASNLPAMRRFAPCSIAALPVYAVDQTCSSVSFTQLVFLLGNFG